MITESDVIKEVAGRLGNAGIQYMFTGSIATNFYAVPRMTRDIDIVVNLKADDALRIYSIFEKDFYIDKDMVLSAINEEGMFNVIHYESVFKIDFIIRKDNQYRLEEFERRRKVMFENVELYIAAPEDLILSKLYWAKESMSEMQINDVRNLLESVKDFNEAYLKKWAGYLGVGEIYQKVKQ
ncbi:MAG: hypothetical protein HZA16_07180 [Nitrospirae bacterium]|nr:hypothetical protein [Nitrospirota bacterium]